MNAFLNPIQFQRAADAAGVDRLKAKSLYSEALVALQALTSVDLKERSAARPLPARAMPDAARGALRLAIEKQNAQRAAAVEVQLLSNVAVTFCAGVVADVRFSEQV